MSWARRDSGEIGDGGAVEIARGLVLNLGGKGADLVQIADGVVDLFPGIDRYSGDDKEQEGRDTRGPAVVPALVAPATATVTSAGGGGLLGDGQLKWLGLDGCLKVQRGAAVFAELVGWLYEASADGTAIGCLLRGQENAPLRSKPSLSMGRSGAILRHRRRTAISDCLIQQIFSVSSRDRVRRGGRHRGN